MIFVLNSCGVRVLENLDSVLENSLPKPFVNPESVNVSNNHHIKSPVRSSIVHLVALETFKQNNILNFSFFHTILHLLNNEVRRLRQEFLRGHLSEIPFDTDLTL